MGKSQLLYLTKRIEGKHATRRCEVFLSYNALTNGSYYLTLQGPVVRTPVSTNLGLNFNLGFFFLLSKAVSRIIFSILFRVSNHQFVGKEN